MKKLVILGGSGIGMIAANIAMESGEYEVAGFLNDVIEVGTQIGKYNKIKVIGTTDNIQYYLDNGYYFFIAYVGLQKEKETFEKIEKFEIPRERYATLIHRTAIIPHGFCNIGYGVLMAPLSQISPDTTIGDNCILLANSFLGHDSTMLKFAHLATNSVVGANVVVGRGVHVGSNSTIREKVDIGDFSLIGSGAVVLNNVDKNTVVVGNPAKKLK
jgi:acetyltransferase EpsM